MTTEGIGNPRARIVLSPDEGEWVEFGGLGVRFMIEEAQSGGTFALVEHPIGPRVLAAPLHTHEREDEYTYVLEGEVGVQVGDEFRVARPGDLVFKPRACRTPSGTPQTRPHGRLSSPLRASSASSRRSHLCSLPPTPALRTSKRSAPSWPSTGSRWASAPSPCFSSVTGSLPAGLPPR
jgi:mannose-6-phosphate isomerase-like protein (cupin superfamily)